MSFEWTEYFIIKPKPEFIDCIKSSTISNDDFIVDELTKSQVIEKLGASTRTLITDKESQILVVKLLWLNHFVKTKHKLIDKSLRKDLFSKELTIEIFNRYWNLEYIEGGYHVDILAEDLGPDIMKSLAQTGNAKADEWLKGRADLIENDHETWRDHARCEWP